MTQTITINTNKIIELIIAAKGADPYNLEYAVDSLNPLEVDTGSQTGVHDLLDVILSYTWHVTGNTNLYSKDAIDSLIAAAGNHETRRITSKILAAACVEGVIVVKRNGKIMPFIKEDLAKFGSEKIKFV